LEGIDAVCLETVVSTHVDRKANKDDLFEIIVSNISIPDEKIPWHDLLAFKNESRSIQQLRALRLWVTDMSNGKLTYGEAVDKVSYLMDEYRSHLRGAGLKFKAGILRTLVVGAAGVAENVLKFKLKDLAEAPFKMFDARTQLVEAERKAVGRELAYAVRAMDELG
jgi:hypothetical protein